MGPLALRLSRAAASYYRHEEQFVRDAWTVFHNLGHESEPAAYNDVRFDHAPAYTADGHEGRRLPKPFETIVETMRRFRDALALEQYLESVESSAVLGGSVSYGRFYNVRGASLTDQGADKVNNPSDLDFLIVVKRRTAIPAFLDALGRAEFISDDSIELAHSRIGPYLALPAGNPSLFSQKFDLWSNGATDALSAEVGARQDYRLSLHIADIATFERLTARPEALDDDQVDHVYDYRVDKPSLGIARGFDGYHEEFNHTWQDVNGGKLVKLRIYDTYDKRYKPGLHQQLILPQFDCRWESSQIPVRLPLVEFKWRIIDRLRYERNLHPLRQQSLALAHVRHHIFSPHVRRRTDDYEREF
jgi:hypothetical protein